MNTADSEIWKSYNHTEGIYNPEIHKIGELFKNTVSNYGDKICVIDETQSITFHELDLLSDHYAENLLTNPSFKNNEIIPFYADRSIYSVATMVGIMKAGKTYVPIAENYPEERKLYISQCCGSDRYYYPEKIDISQLKNNNSTIKHREIEHKKDQLAYIIFTSGTTGLPKGVQISHEGVLNTVIEVNRYLNLTDKDVLICVSSFGFDLSVYDIWAMLTTGSSVIIVENPKDSKHLIDLVSKYNVTIWNSVPAIYDLFIHRCGVLKKYGKEINIPLRHVIMSGDYIPLALCESSRSLSPNTKLTSMGGATEGSIWSIYYPIGTISDNWKTIPYGYPLPGQTMYILDDLKQIAPVDQIGEIAIGGMGVAKGYKNEAEKTKSQFINLPDLGPIYLTGDYGVLRKDEYIEFMGRKDDQVKINGYRIELKEIERQINALPYIERGIVLLYICEEQKAIASVLKLNKNTLEIQDEATIKSEILEDLGKFLPNYMLPSKILIVEDFIYTNNGKVDIKQYQTMISSS